jgi:hypothetical protein
MSLGSLSVNKPDKVVEVDKILEQNYYKKTLEDIGISKNFLNKILVAQEIWARIKKKTVRSQI